MQCIETLSYINSKGVIHKDITPANLFLNNNMTIKVEDFGVSVISGDNLYLNAQYNFCKNKKIECTCTLVGFNCFIEIQIL